MKTFTQRAVFFLIIGFFGFYLSTANKSMAASNEIIKPSDEKAVYQGQNVYQGDYHTTTIYYKNPGSDTWNRMSRSKNYLEVVKCSSALRALNSVGLWYGHLKEDGSCGSLSEPTLFAVGNRINYDAIRAGENP